MLARACSTRPGVAWSGRRSPGQQLGVGGVGPGQLARAGSRPPRSPRRTARAARAAPARRRGTRWSPSRPRPRSSLRTSWMPTSCVGVGVGVGQRLRPAPGRRSGRRHPRGGGEHGRRRPRRAGVPGVRLSAPRSPVRCAGRPPGCGTVGPAAPRAGRWSASRGLLDVVVRVGRARRLGGLDACSRPRSARSVRLGSAAVVGARRLAGTRSSGSERAQLVHRRLLDVPQPPGVPGDRRVEHVARVARVAERPRRGSGATPAPRTAPGLGRRARSRPWPPASGEDLAQLGVGVVVELDRRGEPATPARGWSARNSAIGPGYPATITTRSSRWSSMSLTSVFTASALPYWSSAQRVRLVDEQHAADGAVATTSDVFIGGLPEVAGDQLGAVHLDQVSLAQQPERPVDPGDQPRDRRLAGPGVAQEHQVPGQRRRGQPGLDAQPLDRAAARLRRISAFTRVSPTSASSSASSSSRVVRRRLGCARARSPRRPARCRGRGGRRRGSAVRPGRRRSPTLRAAAGCCRRRHVRLERRSGRSAVSEVCACRAASMSRACEDGRSARGAWHGVLVAESARDHVAAARGPDVRTGRPSAASARATSA